jgi:sodium bicarbonate transporter 10
LISLALLWILKSTRASLLFPLMVLALVGLRKLMDFIPSVFSQKDLQWLDNLMPDSGKKGPKAKQENGIEEEESDEGHETVSAPLHLHV